MSKKLIAVSFAFALAGAALGCAPDEGPVPANPTYTTDVQPIFIARCVHCHGSDEMLHTALVNGSPSAPFFCHLQRYENKGDCSAVPNDMRDCTFGAGAPLCLSQAAMYINLPANLGRMPPPPADPLTPWENAVIERWVTNGGPQ